MIEFMAVWALLAIVLILLAVAFRLAAALSRAREEALAWQNEYRFLRRQKR